MVLRRWKESLGLYDNEPVAMDSSIEIVPSPGVEATEPEPPVQRSRHPDYATGIEPGELVKVYHLPDSWARGVYRGYERSNGITEYITLEHEERTIFVVPWKVITRIAVEQRVASSEEGG